MLGHAWDTGHGWLAVNMQEPNQQEAGNHDADGRNNSTPVKLSTLKELVNDLKELKDQEINIINLAAPVF